jgi:hypothetical protein
MSLPFRRRIAWAIALCYVWASALSGMWHNHAHEDAGGHACKPVVEHVHHDCHGDTVAHQDSSDRHGPTSDDDCVVCRFVAQSAVKAPLAPPVTWGQLIVEAPAHLPAAVAPVFFSCSLARAPPAIG